MKFDAVRAIRRSVACVVAVYCLSASPGWGQEPQLKDLPPEVSGQSPQKKPGVPTPDSREGRAAPEGSEPEAPPQTGHSLLHSVDLLVRAQAQRLLDLTTAGNGDNATAIVGRFQLQTEYRDLRGNQAILRNVARVDLPIGERFLIRMDVPFYNARFTPSDASHTWTGGLGDVFIRLGARVYNTPALQLFAGSEVVFPTSDEDELGRKKYSLGPGIAISAPIPEWGAMLFWRFQHIVSVGGDPSEKDVDQTRLRFRFAKPLSANWWVHAEPEIRIDWTNGAKTAVLSQFEIGRRLDDHWRLFMRPAVGVTNNDVPGAYDWFIRFGVRYMF
jgi:hypothetical protein